jgi:hypothetical protein
MLIIHEEVSILNFYIDAISQRTEGAHHFGLLN